MSNLRLINETEITSSVSSVNMSDVFSADFDIYKITINGIKTAGTVAVRNRIRVINTSGSVSSQLAYDNAYLQAKSWTTFGEGRNTSGTSITTPIGASDNPDSGNTTMYVFNPYNSSSYTFFLYQANSFFNGNMEMDKGIAVFKVQNLISGFQLLDDTGTAPFDTGFIRTYGLRVDS
jgi:hypothetical protein